MFEYKNTTEYLELIAVKIKVIIYAKYFTNTWLISLTFVYYFTKCFSIAIVTLVC